MSTAEGLALAEVRDAAPLFAALGDETRLRLLVRLTSGGPSSMAQLGAKAQVSRQAIAKHVDVLAGAGLVRTSRRGRERICELTPARLADAREYLERISRQWDGALDRLKRFVEDGGTP
jgi:DNA-binding transcriptional ArsR family regulator